LISDTTYKIIVTVTAPDYAPSVAEVIGTVNNLPYGGACNVNTLVGEYCIIVTSSVKIWLMGDKKTRFWLDFMSHLSTFRKHFSRILYNLNKKLPILTFTYK